MKDQIDEHSLRNQEIADRAYKLGYNDGVSNSKKFFSGIFAGCAISATTALWLIAFTL